MATVMGSIANTLVQEILPSLYEVGWGLDPFYPMVRRSWHRVKKNSGIGRGFTVTKNWKVGMAGGAMFRAAQGHNVVSGLDNVNIHSTPQTFQSVDETVMPAFPTSTVTLQEQACNLFVPNQIMRADRLDASIGSVMQCILQGFSELVTQQEMALFYSTAPSTAAIGDLGNTSDTVANVSGDTSAITVDFGHANSGPARVHRFRPGMMVDLYDSTGATKRNSSFNIVVDDVNPLARTITLKRFDGQTFQTTTTLNGGVTYATAGGDDDIIVLKDSVSVTPGSLEAWIADGSTISTFFDIDVTSHSQFRSFVPAAVSAALTETILNKYVGWFRESFPGKKLSEALTTTGVLLGFIENLDGYSAANANAGRFRYDRNGQAMQVEAGWDTFNYRFAGRPLDMYTSTYAQEGNLYAGAMKGEITRYVPPPIPGATVNSKFGAELEFLAALGGSGYQGIFTHAYSTGGRMTNFLQAPSVRNWVCMPNQPNFMKLSGITPITDWELGGL